jgi:hypothetical protein
MEMEMNKAKLIAAIVLVIVVIIAISLFYQQMRLVEELKLTLN